MQRMISLPVNELKECLNTNISPAAQLGVHNAHASAGWGTAIRHLAKDASCTTHASSGGLSWTSRISGLRRGQMGLNTLHMC